MGFASRARAGLLGLVALAGVAHATYIDVVLASNPIAYWRFEELLLTDRAIDSSANQGSQDGDYMGGVTLGQASAWPALGNAALFDGSTGYVQINQTAGGTIIDLRQWIGIGSGSIEFWMRAASAIGGSNSAWQAPGVAGIEQAGGGNDIFWGWFDGARHVRVSAANDDTSSAVSDDALNDDAWHHIVLTRAASGATQVFVDGVQNGPTQPGTVLGSIAAAFSSIGRIEDTGGTPNYFRGYLDEVAIYDRVLTPGEVWAHYTSVPEPATLSLVSLGALLLLRRRRRA